MFSQCGTKVMSSCAMVALLLLLVFVVYPNADQFRVLDSKERDV